MNRRRFVQTLLGAIASVALFRADMPRPLEKSYVRVVGRDAQGVRFDEIYEILRDDKRKLLSLGVTSVRFEDAHKIYEHQVVSPMTGEVYETSRYAFYEPPSKPVAQNATE